MASVNAINSQVSFQGSHKKPESKKPGLVNRINRAYVETINKKYDVDYDSLSLKQKRTLDKDYFTEKTLCAGLSLISIALLIKKGRAMLNGAASAAGASFKRFINKPVDNMITGGDNGICKWAGNKIATAIHAPVTKKLNTAINDNVGRIIKNQNEIISNGSAAVSNALDQLNKLLSDYKYDKAAINMQDIQALLKTMGEKSGNGSATEIMSLKYLDQIEKLDLEKTNVAAFTEKLAADLTENLNNWKKSFSVTPKTMKRMADEIERAENPDLAAAIRGLIPKKIADDEVFTISNIDFNTIVANNKMTVFEKIKPGKVDQESKLHKFLNKIFKKEGSLETIEDALGKQGITDGGKLVETGLATGVAVTSGDKIYKTIDEITDLNDEDMAKLTEDQNKIEDFKDVVRNRGGKLNAQHVKQLLNIAAEVGPALFDAA